MEEAAPNVHAVWEIPIEDPRNVSWKQRVSTASKQGSGERPMIGFEYYYKLESQNMSPGWRSGNGQFSWSIPVAHNPLTSLQRLTRTPRNEKIAGSIPALGIYFFLAYV
jgi:hypothetical protein